MTFTNVSAEAPGSELRGGDQKITDNTRGWGGGGMTIKAVSVFSTRLTPVRHTWYKETEFCEPRT